ncbi:SRPBCC family protein [Paracrocinitomix mangrovi]|uniref:SRPBCC family protein n=1 Tax=Paracrocinitomix mangrovi TaxID=2862509 RepID=UPI001C8EE320|nr:SRPBCC family protein [Paracrocinitomix mangrovi]UKN02358.1 SRPBCC family protein [Paracrocinitomix mangrovi]
MPKIFVEKSIYIDKSPSEVFPLINDFSVWPTWSPWLITEKGVKVNVRDDKKFYEWSGDLVGSGNMMIIDEKENDFIDCDLQFIKPFKSKAKTSMYVKAEGNGTLLRWTMNSSLPFFMFFFKKMMQNLIGLDYERGLKMIKDLAETGEINSTLEFNENQTFEGGKYIYLTNNCQFKDMADTHKADFTSLMEFARSKNIIAGVGFTIYDKWDMKNLITHYKACVLVSDIPSDLPAGFSAAEFPKIKSYTCTHTGPYRHIGNAWSGIQMRLRAKKFKHNKKVSPIEVYLNSPLDTAEKALKTVIHFATV